MAKTPPSARYAYEANLTLAMRAISGGIDMAAQLGRETEGNDLVDILLTLHAMIEDSILGQHGPKRRPPLA